MQRHFDSFRCARVLASLNRTRKSVERANSPLVRQALTVRFEEAPAARCPGAQGKAVSFPYRRRLCCLIRNPPCAKHPIRTSLRHVALCSRETGIWRAETEAPKPAHHIQLIFRRDKVFPRNPANSGLFLGDQEISVYRGLRGGAERTRTSGQVIISRFGSPNSQRKR